MKCTVLFFAQARDLAGCERCTIEVPDAATAGHALERVMHLHPALAAMRDHLAIAVDERYANAATPLRDDCTIALIPPVSGG